MHTQGKKRTKTIKNIIWYLIATVLLIVLLIKTDFDLIFLLKKVLWPLFRLISIMAITLFLSALIEAKGWSRLVATLSRPIMKMGRLSDWSGTAFTTAFLSGIAASTIIWNAYKEGKITQKEMFICALLNVGLPSYFLHLPVTFAIIVPLTQQAGLLYMAITFIAALIRTIFVIFLGRTILAKEEKNDVDIHKSNVKKKQKDTLKIFKKYLTKRLLSIATYTIPIYILVVLLRVYGFFNYLQEVSAYLIKTNLFPVEGVSVVVFSIVAEFSAGAAAAGAMLQEGILSIKETVMALVFGNIIATPVRALRHQLPRYLGIFTPKTGILLLISGQLLRIVSVIIATCFFWWIYK